MIGSEAHDGRSSQGLTKRRLMTILPAACLIIACAGCSLMPGSARDLAGKVGLRSKEAELRAKVEADKFPSAKEAGI
jgi:hypothetical protein